jgi:hypothetical protein
MNAETEHLMHKVRGNYSSCACRSSENICRSSGGAQEKGKRGSKPHETQFGTKMVRISEFHPPLKKAIVLFRRFFFWISPGLGPNSGFWCCVFLTFTDFFLYYVATNIKGWFKICTLFPVYSQIWLNLSRDDCQCYGMITTLVTNKDTSQSTAPGMTRPALCNKLECATYTLRL